MYRPMLGTELAMGRVSHLLEEAETARRARLAGAGRRRARAAIGRALVSLGARLLGSEAAVLTRAAPAI